MKKKFKCPIILYFEKLEKYFYIFNLKCKKTARKHESAILFSLAILLSPTVSTLIKIIKLILCISSEQVEILPKFRFVFSRLKTINCKIRRIGPKIKLHC